MANWSRALPFSPESAALIPEDIGLFVFLSEQLENRMYKVIYVEQTSNLRARFLDYVNGEEPYLLEHAVNYRYVVEPKQDVRDAEEKLVLTEGSPILNLIKNGTGSADILLK
ncbi:hypothetical protein [Paenibacillus apiarius]|uniref:Uncharacterized protein n=1 Tax=Paenibacillus apiarius TaxID=46240 RepID=A0ABT4DQC0_9BACL|nr:hypothetical protein [Paenibacillus apiarius]MCY9514031.1 hypothetical protein [Paenibacillus apiarius]MCY9519548.1 hypothetical protein [Paenibacillus apiarius]MCY9552475.1 hypothetical protein [Paenibacillus apiarius]MCY9556304.1 hypothetical protein [Paenibacillus apiarius]MCY9681838.1 hypothetical protein [Paenibacillus apiarius]